MRPLGGAGFLLFLTTQVFAANSGNGFAESIRPLQSARQAGSGSLTLAGLSNEGTVLEANTLLLEPGLRWYGLGVQTGMGNMVRILAEAFMFRPEITRTVENSDGSFGGEAGAVDFQEWGARVLGRMLVWKNRSRQIAVLGRVTSWVQDLSGFRNVPFTIETGVQVVQRVGTATNLLAYGLLGPLGRGASRWHVNQGTVGAGFVTYRAKGLFGKENGFGLGLELQSVGEGLLHAGLGGVYWFGHSVGAGSTFFIRAGARHMAQSIQSVEPHAGLGYLWRTANGLGIQLDYAIVPLGVLGTFNYVTVSLRLPS